MQNRLPSREFAVALGSGNVSNAIPSPQPAKTEDLISLAGETDDLGVVAKILYVETQTILNANKAAELAVSGIEKALIFTGRGSNPEANYGITEAEAMTRWFEALRHIDVGIFAQLAEVVVEKEEQSTDTFENIEYIGGLLDEYNPNEVTIVGSKKHAQRAAVIARALYGKRYEYFVEPSLDDAGAAKGILRAVQLKAAERALKKHPRDYEAFKESYRKNVPNIGAAKRVLGI